MAMKKKTITKTKPLNYRISRTIFSLSVLGTMWRTALFVAMLCAIVLLSVFSLLKSGGSAFAPGSLLSALYGIVIYSIAFVIYDTVYVYIVRRYGEIDVADKVILFGIEFIVASVLLLSAAFGNFVNVNSNVLNETYSLVFWTLLLATLLLPLRAFIGVSYVVMTRKQK